MDVVSVCQRCGEEIVLRLQFGMYYSAFDAETGVRHDCAVSRAESAWAIRMLEQNAASAESQTAAESKAATLLPEDESADQMGHQRTSGAKPRDGETSLVAGGSSEAISRGPVKGRKRGKTTPQGRVAGGS